MNTQSNPKTIFEVPGLSCSIMKIPKNTLTPGSIFHKELLAAKNKGEAIDILYRRGSQHGWFTDMPDGLFEKLEQWRSPQKTSA